MSPPQRPDPGSEPIIRPDPGPEPIIRLRAENAALQDRLRNAERYTARALMRATRLSQVIAVLGTDDDLETMTARAAVQLAELFSADIALLLLESDDGLRIEGHWGLRAYDPQPDGSSLRALEETAAAGIAAACDVPLPDWLASYEPRHVAWARLVVGDRSLGLVLLIRRADEPYEPDDETELRAITYRIALAVENGLLHRHMRAQLAQLHRLQVLTAELTGLIEPRAVGQRVADTLVAEAGVTSSIVTIEREGRTALLAGAGISPDRARLLAADIPALADEWISIPLSVADRSVGFVAVQGAPTAGSARHELLMHLVGLAALALDKALLYELSREQARHDGLTGLLRHRVFHEMLDKQIDGGNPFSIVLFDIDDFKEINDLHGHQAGDEVLRIVAGALRRGVRGEDSIFRVGGEEFGALMPDISPPHARAAAERIRTGLAYAGSELPYPITLSAGVASFPGIARDRDGLMAGADAALYVSKRAGKNRTSVAGEDESIEVTNLERSARLELLFQKDADTVTHSIHTANLAVRVARVLGLPDGRVADLRVAAKLHDIGKIGVPDAILDKPGPLNDEEFRVVKTHPIVGAELLVAWDMPVPARIVRQHHERVDGAGYPAGLRGQEIELESLILHACDAFVAMTLDRPYRAAMTDRAAIEEIVRHRGTQFDEHVVDALLLVCDADRAWRARSTATC